MRRPETISRAKLVEDAAMVGVDADDIDGALEALGFCDADDGRGVRSSDG